MFKRRLIFALYAIALITLACNKTYGSEISDDEYYPQKRRRTRLVGKTQQAARDELSAVLKRDPTVEEVVLAAQRAQEASKTKCLYLTTDLINRMAHRSTANGKAYVRQLDQSLDLQTNTTQLRNILTKGQRTRSQKTFMELMQLAIQILDHNGLVRKQDKPKIKEAYIRLAGLGEKELALQLKTASRYKNLEEKIETTKTYQTETDDETEKSNEGMHKRRKSTRNKTCKRQRNSEEEQPEQPLKIEPQDQESIEEIPLEPSQPQTIQPSCGQKSHTPVFTFCDDPLPPSSMLNDEDLDPKHGYFV